MTVGEEAIAAAASEINTCKIRRGSTQSTWAQSAHTASSRVCTVHNRPRMGCEYAHNGPTPSYHQRGHNAIASCPRCTCLESFEMFAVREGSAWVTDEKRVAGLAAIFFF